MTRRAVVAAPLLASALLGGVLAVFAAQGWPGAPNDCIARDTCYCEAFRPGPVKQPANTWSCLAYVLVGLLVAADGARRLGGGTRMSSAAFYPALFGTAIALIGPASMALHAGMTDWGGMVDGVSMDLFILLAVTAALARRLDLSDRGFLVCYGAFVSVGALRSFLIPLGWREVVYAVPIAGVLVLEGLPDRRVSDRTWLWTAAGLMAAALAFWLPSRTPSGPLCRPESLLQGHAAWHVLAALAAGSLYLHFRAQPGQHGAGSRLGAGGVDLAPDRLPAQ